jgi:hypothetical protein
MNWNSRFGISLFLAVSAGVLSVGQAWVLGSAATRWPRYLVAWLGSSVVLAWAGGVVLALESADGSIRAEMRLVLFVLALVIAAAGLWSGAYWGGAQAAEAETFMGRVRALLVVIVIGLSHIH